MEALGRVLVVDDEPNARSALAELLRDEGYVVETAADGWAALPRLEELAPDLVLTDLRMPGMDGMALMKRAWEGDPERAVVVMTAYDSVDTAVAAMRAGAADYLRKPINVDELLLVITRVLERRRLCVEAARLRQRLAERRGMASIVGSSAPMQRVFDTARRVARSDAPILITGESGTGKGLIAEALHEHSARAGGPFVKLHCAALAEAILESELFGHRHDGRCQRAHGGTLFLDEIAEMSPATQVKLLRLLQEPWLDVRIIAATNRDLVRLVTEGGFREDLYDRLRGSSIEMPSLRARSSDIPLLAAHFLRRYAAEHDKEILGFGDDAFAAMAHYGWPGNVRELENAVERAVIVCRTGVVRAPELGPQVGPAEGAGDGGPPIPGSTLVALERHAILTTLEHTGGSTSRAAEILGISTRTCQDRLREYQGQPQPAGGPPSPIAP